MRRIWDTNAPDPSSLWRAANAPDTAGFSRRNRFAKPVTATVPDPHFKTPLEAPLVNQDENEYNPILKIVNGHFHASLNPSS